MRAKPLYIALSPSTYCNASCVMCDHWTRPREELPESVWDELPTFLPTLAHLTLLGGEPMANPRVISLLGDAGLDKYPSLRIDLVTNGSLFSDRMLQRIRKVALGCVTVSVNAGNAEAYEKIQGTLRFQDILHNLDALVRFRCSHPRWFGVTVSCVVQPPVASSLVQFGEIALARNVDIRLLPLMVKPFSELDFYQSTEQVADVIDALDRFASFAEAKKPEWLVEIGTTKRQVQALHAARVGACATPPQGWPPP